MTKLSIFGANELGTIQKAESDLKKKFFFKKFSNEKNGGGWLDLDFPTATPTDLAPGFLGGRVGKSKLSGIFLTKRKKCHAFVLFVGFFSKFSKFCRMTFV